MYYKYLLFFITLLICYEIFFSLHRQYNRVKYYKLALNRSKQIKKPLIVIGDPANGTGSKLFGPAYGYGDYCVDLSGCPKGNSINIKGDVVEALKKFGSNSSVIFVSHVLEYVENIDECIKELKRVGGENLYIVTIGPYCITSYVYYGESTTRNVFKNNPPNGDFDYFKL